MNLSNINMKFSGLENLGNTCFLNSCIQIMSNTEELNNFLNTLNKVKDLDDAIILKEYNGLRKMMNDNNVISPKRFIYYIHQVSRKKGRTLFSGYEQNDMMEFMNFLLDCIHNSISRPISVNITGTPKHDKDNLAIVCYKYIKEVYEKEYSEIMEIFYGVYVSEIKSIKGKTYSCKPEYYSTLDLPINETTQTIYDCFDLFTQSEEISDYRNDKTNKIETVYKNMSFWNFPKILILCLKRYTNNGKKKHKVIECPDTIDLSGYLKGYNVNNKYDLYAVCNHIGGVMGGHYTCYIKRNNVWFHINDDKIGILKENVISSKSYCLFYRKKNN